MLPFNNKVPLWKAKPGAQVRVPSKASSPSKRISCKMEFCHLELTRLLIFAVLFNALISTEAKPQRNDTAPAPASVLLSNLVSNSNNRNGAAESTSKSKRLKVCQRNQAESGTPFKDFVELPTFSMKTMSFVLQMHSLNKEGDFFNCKNGKKPISSNDFITISKRDIDHDIQENQGNPSFIFHVLRAVNLLMENGYMSVAVNDTANYFSPSEFCIDSITGEKDDAILQFKICPSPKSRPILPKCCPLGTFLQGKTCAALPEGETWKPEYFDSKTKAFLTFDEANPAVTSPLLSCSEERETWISDHCSFDFHPTMDNRVAFVGAYRKWEYIQKNVSKCFELLEQENGTLTTILFHCAGSEGKNQTERASQARISLVYMVNMYIGAFFHFLTTTVYLITWAKQNIHGKTLCSCTASLFFMQIFLGTAHLLGQYKNLRKPWFCIGNSIGGQYFMIAAFTWLLVVNIDLWRTFRSLRTNNTKSLRRFLVFSTFGWGLPLVITAVSIALNFKFTCRASGIPVPEYGEHYCFVAPWAQGYYVYYILSVLIGLTCIFAALTLFSLYSFKKDTENIRSSKRAADKQNVLLFLKLGVVMGLTWIFEVISWAATKDDDSNHFLWIIIDLYNSLSAILIFIIFVCKRTTLNLLEQTVPYLKGISAALSKITGETASDHTASTAVGGNGSSTGGLSLKAMPKSRDGISCDNPGYNSNEYN